MLRFLLYTALFLFLSAIICISAVAYIFVPNLPNIDALKDVQLQVPLRIYSKDGSLMSEFGDQRRIPIKMHQVPENLANAFLAAEDDRFYDHPGVDWQGLVRAAISVVKTGSKKQGGSTITMQVARNFFLNREKTYTRKINEIFLALKIEQELSKDEIFELYLNKIFLGQRAYGIGAAAQIYYSKELQELTLAEMAMIAGIPPAPSKANPVTNIEKALLRRAYVLKRMLDLEHITQEEYDIANAAEPTASLYSAKVELQAPYVSEMIRQELLSKMGESVYASGLSVISNITNKHQIAAQNAVQKNLKNYDKRHGYRGAEAQIEITGEITTEKADEILNKYPVIANLHSALVLEANETEIKAYAKQSGEITLTSSSFKWAGKLISENYKKPVPKQLNKIVSVGDIIRITPDEEGVWQFAQLPNVEGSLVSVNPNNGKVLALVGGFDFFNSKFNRVTQALRQPGSGFKPFIYSAALASGKTAASIVNDAPIVLNNGSSAESDWRPQNYSKKSYGPTRIREALTHSRNLVSIRLLNEIGVSNALPHIAKFGFDTNALPKNLSLSLGSGAVTPWQLAKAYSVLANGGYEITPHIIDKITTPDEEVVFVSNYPVVCKTCNETNEFEQDNIQNARDESKQADDLIDNTVQVTQKAKRVVDKNNIWIMNSILRDVVKFGTGRRALSLGRNDLAGKTGTTNDQHDAWFSGFNANLVAIAWVGFDKFKPLGGRETGASAALPMWVEYMKYALEGEPEAILPQPEGMVSLRIDKFSGRPTSADNPNAIFETFRKENAPNNIDSNSPSPFDGGSSSAPIPADLF